jgi:hypothetical protein
MRTAMVRPAVVLALVLGAFIGAAFAGPDKPIASAKSLAGEWRSVGGASAAAIRIKADGSYEGTSASGAKTTGKVTVASGKASFQSTASTGTVTLSEQSGTDVLLFMSADGKSSARLQRVK